MAQFNVIATWMLQQNQTYQKLLQDLQSKRMQCMKLTNNNTEFCSRDTKDFQQYLRIYTKQTVEKGFRLCKQMVDQQPTRNQDEVIDECMTLYSMNMEIYEKNVVDKIRSLADKFSVQNL